jgi:hypothetical protein
MKLRAARANEVPLRGNEEMKLRAARANEVPACGPAMKKRAEPADEVALRANEVPLRGNEVPAAPAMKE